MRYVRKKDLNEARRVVRGLTDFPNIHSTGSVRGMQQIYRWPRGGQVLIAGFIYNVGTENVQKLRDAGLLRGDRV